MAYAVDCDLYVIHRSINLLDYVVSQGRMCLDPGGLKPYHYLPIVNLDKEQLDYSKFNCIATSLHCYKSHYSEQSTRN